MKELIEVLNSVRKKMTDHEADLNTNEAMTRYALIDPLLKVLGWDVSDPSIVKPEEYNNRSRIDYTMGKTMVVEAKKLDGLADRDSKQLVKYIEECNAQFGVLTDGRRWKIYEPRVTTSTPQEEFDVTDPDDVVIPKIVKLSRAVISKNPASATTKDATRPDDWTPLSQVRYVKNTPSPTELRCRDNILPLTSWAGILTSVAKYLIDNKHLSKSDCPVRKGPKTHLLNTELSDTDDKRVYTKVSGFYLYRNNAPKTAIQYALRLISAARLEESAFSVRLENRR